MYSIAGEWHLKSDRVQVRLNWLLLLPAIFFVALWFVGSKIWELAWAIRYVDVGVGDQYIDYLGNLTAGTIALAVSVTILVRVATGVISKRNLLSLTYGVTLLSALFIAFVVASALSR
jgi:hypothetical protein